jgi:epoxyqueuosine reductase
MQIFCNSRLAEKLFAWASGLGTYGRNSLIITEELGSVFIIGGLLLKLRVDSNAGKLAGIGDICGECDACITACPVGAIGPDGIIDSSKCIQALAVRMERFGESVYNAWGYTIYGCEKCQEICPHNQGLVLSTKTELGEIGPGIPLQTILEKTPQELKTYFKNTALGLSWIDPEAIRRNALIAAGNRKNRVILNHIRSFSRCDNSLLCEIAGWAEKKITTP